MMSKRRVTAYLIITTNYASKHIFLHIMRVILTRDLTGSTGNRFKAKVQSHGVNYRTKANLIKPQEEKSKKLNSPL